MLGADTGLGTDRHCKAINTEDFLTTNSPCSDVRKAQPKDIKTCKAVFCIIPWYCLFKDFL